MTKPLDQFWVLTDEQSSGRVGYVSVAYSRPHKHADGQTFLAITPTFKTAEDLRSHMLRMVADLNDAIGSIDAAFGSPNDGFVTSAIIKI